MSWLRGIAAAGRNGYIDRQTLAGVPEGGHQANVDGGAHWYALDQMRQAVKMPGWGENGGLNWQWWAWKQ